MVCHHMCKKEENGLFEHTCIWICPENFWKDTRETNIRDCLWGRRQGIRNDGKDISSLPFRVVWIFFFLEHVTYLKKKKKTDSVSA